MRSVATLRLFFVILMSFSVGLAQESDENPQEDLSPETSPSEAGDSRKEDGPTAPDDKDAAIGFNEPKENTQEAEIEEAGEAEAQDEPIPEGTGRVVGQVFNEASGEFLNSVSALMELQGATGEDSFFDTTDARGRFTFEEVPSGRYIITLTRDGYQTRKRSITVMPDETATPKLTMAPSAQEQDNVFDLAAFDVTVEELSSQGVALENLRRGASASVNFLTSEDFSKFGAGDIAEAIVRVPGVSAQDGQFAVIRGLNERYSTTLINTVPVPSADPEKQSVQLDLFPSSIIGNLVVKKTFLPDMPGNAAGGALYLETKAFPEESEAKISVGVKFNSNAFDGTYYRDLNRGPLDYFAFGKNERVLNPVSPDGSIAPSAVEPFSFAPRVQNAPPGGSFSFNVGDTMKFLDRDFGIIVGGSYRSSYKAEVGVQNDRVGISNLQKNPLSPFGIGPNFAGDIVDPGSLQGTFPTFDRNVSTAEVLLSALASLTGSIDKEGNHQITGTGLVSQSGINRVRANLNGVFAQEDIDAFNALRTASTSGGGGQIDLDDFFRGVDSSGFASPAAFFENTGQFTLNSLQTSYQERFLRSLQLHGDHVWPELDDFKLDWSVASSKTTSDNPDQTDFIYLFNRATNTFETRTETQLGSPAVTRNWTSIDENQTFGRIDGEYDLKFLNDLTGKLQMGYLHENSNRSVNQSTLEYDIAAPVVASDFDTFIERVETQVLGINPTPNSSNLIATRQVNSFYGSATLPLGDKIKLIGGARVENIEISSEGAGRFGFLTAAGYFGDRFTFQGQQISNAEILGVPGVLSGGTLSGEINQERLLPGISLIYEPNENLTFRTAYSQTAARPSFRELSAYVSRDPLTGDLLIGNPGLQLSDVDSYDFRVEYYFENGDLIAGSVFYKDINRPIEKITLIDQGSGTAAQTFFNNPDRAVLKGIELEARKNLAFIAPELEHFSIGGNFTYIDASVAVPDNIREAYQQTGTNGLPAGIGIDENFQQGNFPPEERRLFDQPEWIANADITFRHPDMGTTITLSVFAISDVLISAGTPFVDANTVTGAATLDQYNDSYYQLDVTFSQQLTEELKFKFGVKNITDTERRVIYDPDFVDQTRLRYKKGLDYSFSVEYVF